MGQLSVPEGDEEQRRTLRPKVRAADSDPSERPFHPGKSGFEQRKRGLSSRLLFTGEEKPPRRLHYRESPVGTGKENRVLPEERQVGRRTTGGADLRGAFRRPEKESPDEAGGKPLLPGGKFQKS